MKHIILFDNDIKKYPPILSIINILLELGKEVIFIGYTDSESLLEDLKNKGVKHYPIVVDKVKKNKITKLLVMVKYRKSVNQILKTFDESATKVWLFGNTNVWILNKLVYRYKTIVYLFEVSSLKVAPQYRFVSPWFSYKDTIQNAWRVVTVEYNRAHITKFLFGLSELPAIIPNKPYFKGFQELSLKLEIEEALLSRLKEKKVILYQGIFNYPERRLDELCEAIDLLSDEYILCIMGPEDVNKDRLQKKYKSNKIIFMPFITPPTHLEITKLAYIGFLTYFPSNSKMSSILNVLYCAPNKIYEYSAFGVPMLSNDVPALDRDFRKFNAGVCVKEFTPKSIAEAIKSISINYDEYKEGANKLFNSVDIKEEVHNIIMKK